MKESCREGWLFPILVHRNGEACVDACALDFLTLFKSLPSIYVILFLQFVGFKSFVQGVVLETRDILKRGVALWCRSNELGFVELQDVIMERKNGFYLIDIEKDRLGGGLRYC
jgi:hypothetical protein